MTFDFFGRKGPGKTTSIQHRESPRNDHAREWRRVKVIHMRRTVILTGIVVGLVAIVVSVVAGGGWGIFVLEVAGGGLACFFFWREQNEDASAEPE